MTRIHRQFLTVCFAGILALSGLSGCAAKEEAAAVPETEPVPEVEVCGMVLTGEDTCADFSALKEADLPEMLRAVEELPGLTEVILPSEEGMPLTGYMELYDVRPDIRYTYAFTLFDQEVSTETETLKYKKQHIGDEGLETFTQILPYLPELEYLSFDRCSQSNEALAQLRDSFPEVKIVWRVFFADYSCMTDAEKIWAIAQLNDSNAGALQYCTDIRYLDVGHNDLRDVSFLNHMPKLEVCILAINEHLTDVSCLGNCRNLEYLELTNTPVSDISFLAELKNLKHLELSLMNNLEDISPVMELDLERFHAMYDFGIPYEQKQEFMDKHPDCDVNFSLSWENDPFNESNWREEYGAYVPRYQLLREQIGYDDPYGRTLLYAIEDKNDPDYVYTGPYIREQDAYWD